MAARLSDAPRSGAPATFTPEAIFARSWPWPARTPETLDVPISHWSQRRTGPDNRWHAASSKASLHGSVRASPPPPRLKKAGQKNLWATSGSGSLPGVRYKAVSTHGSFGSRRIFGDSEFGLVVEALNDAAGELLFGMEIVQDERFARARSDLAIFFHRFDARAHDLTATTSSMEPASPGRRFILPELLEILLQQIGVLYGPVQVVTQQVAQAEALMFG